LAAVLAMKLKPMAANARRPRPRALAGARSARDEVAIDQSAERLKGVARLKPVAP